MSKKENIPTDFEKTYQKHYSGVFRYVYRLIGIREEAEQISQQAFTKMYIYSRNGNSVQSAKALIYRIAGNICLDVLRKKTKEKHTMLKRWVQPHEPIPPSEITVREQQLTRIRWALALLPSRDQKCLLLYQEGFSYQEIAAICRMNKNSVGKVLSRATHKLAGIIREGEKS